MEVKTTQIKMDNFLDYTRKALAVFQRFFETLVSVTENCGAAVAASTSVSGKHS